MTMTPAQIRRIRVDKLGLSANAFATITGTASGRTVRRWEAGDIDVPAYIEAICELLMLMPSADRMAYIQARGRDPDRRSEFLARKLAPQ